VKWLKNATEKAAERMRDFMGWFLISVGGLRSVTVCGCGKRETCWLTALRRWRNELHAPVETAASGRWHFLSAQVMRARCHKKSTASAPAAQ
jgi:hypothetical protein